MKAIERAKTHFAEQDVKVIKVPEWGEEDKPLEIYSKPLTLSETSKLYKMSKNDDLTMMAYVLIYKALDENGDKFEGWFSELSGRIFQHEMDHMLGNTFYDTASSFHMKQAKQKRKIYRRRMKGHSG